MKIAYVVWRDAIAEEALEPGRAVTPRLCELHEIGFLLGETEEAVTIGMEVDGPDVQPGRWRLHIPRAAIVRLDVRDLSRAFRAPRAKSGRLTEAKVG